MSTVQAKDVNGRPWLAVVYTSVWLLFLEGPVVAAVKLLPASRGFLGIVVVLAFAVAYLAAFMIARRDRRAGAVAPLWWGPAVIAALSLLAAVVCLCVGQSGTATFVFIAVSVVMNLRWQWAIATVVVLAGLSEVLSLTLPGWEHDSSLTLSIVLAAFAMFGVLQVIARNSQLVDAHEENARLAVSEERNRLARDLHDILGHSLTVITVKAELAQRLFDADPERARAEVADLERLSRDALSDVRRAVAGYRDLTLPGELARAKMALEAAGIAADVPNAAEEVPSNVRDLFAWTVREGVTNVIRHSHANHCSIVLGPRSVEVRDDGRGSDGGPPGSGLLGLRERARENGATVVVETLAPGFSLKVLTR